MNEFKNLENGLIELSQEKFGLKLKKIQRLSLALYEIDMMQELIKECKFKSKGSIYDYSDKLPIPQNIYGYDILDIENINKIYVSKKYDAVFISSLEDGQYYYLQVFINIKNLNKFSKALKPIIRKNIAQVNFFKDVDFKCKKSEYIEVVKTSGKKDKDPVGTITRTITDEKLVFDKKSTVSEVLRDIGSFFTNETKELYKSIDILYKRGIILYGDPGNGKSAAIREILRRSDEGISKIVINPNIGYEFTTVLSSLLRSLKGRQAIIVIEDLDSLVSKGNRSDFLNILDGIDVQSGVYFIGTTNYPERIDPAIMNRSGRFDKAYEIPNPSKETRKLFFESRNVDVILEKFKIKDNEDIIELFTKYTDGLPMASLKEIITSVNYTLVAEAKTELSIEDAIKLACEKIKGSKLDHIKAHNKFKESKKKNDEDDEEFVDKYNRDESGGIPLSLKI